MQNTRQQLSMYADVDTARDIEAVRALIDPVQSSLIPVHVTLCREDELTDIAALRDKLKRITYQPLTLSFGKAAPFSTHGWLLSCIAGEAEFRGLREYLLNSTHIREQKPHITLAHPRNAKSAGNTPANVSVLPDGIELIFSSIVLIEQQGTAPWRVIETFPLPA